MRYEQVVFAPDRPSANGMMPTKRSPEVRTNPHIREFTASLNLYLRLIDIPPRAIEQRLGVPKMLISDLKNGYTIVGEITLRRFCRMYGIPYGDEEDLVRLQENVIEANPRIGKRQSDYFSVNLSTLEKLRREKGWTPTRLATETGIPTEVIHAVISEKTPSMNLRFLRILEEELEIPVTDLITATEETDKRVALLVPKAKGTDTPHDSPLHKKVLKSVLGKRPNLLAKASVLAKQLTVKETYLLAKALAQTRNLQQAVALLQDEEWKKSQYY